MKKNGKENFEKLEERVKNGLYDSDLELISYGLQTLDKPTLVSGVGGSSVVSTFATKVLNEKNHIIAENIEPRDFKYKDVNNYHNVLSCSYSGNNYGVELSFLNNLKHYLLSSKENNNPDIYNLTYTCNDPEKSFISLGATLIPCSILLNYYLDGDTNQVIDLFEEKQYDFDTSIPIYEIFSGYDTSTTAKYLESTLAESGIGIPIVHDKYSYCHGRSTISKNYKTNCIYLNTHKELDNLLLEEFKKMYDNLIIIDVEKGLKGDYKALIESMYLTKYIADAKNMDLSGVDYHPIVKKLYKYKGEL